MIFRRLNKRNISGQIAVIITLVIAAIFLLLLVFVNISKISLIKTLTAQTTDRVALSLASKLGTLSHMEYLSDVWTNGPPGPPNWNSCGITWWKVILIGVGVVGAILFPPLIGFLGLSLSLTYAAYAISAGLVGYGFKDAINNSRAVDDAIRKSFAADMSGYSGLRESALYDVVKDIQMDDISLLNKGGDNQGVFFDDLDKDGVYDSGEPFTDTNHNGVYDAGEPFTDTNHNGVYDAGEPEYNLRNIGKQRNLNKVGRFWAWYYSKRLPLIIAGDPSNEVNNFVTGLQQYIDIDKYDNVTWAITRASFTVEPASSGYGSAMSVTCGSSCPPWVADASGNRVRIVTIDESNRDVTVPPAPPGDGHYFDLGFLSAKLLSLGTRLTNMGYDVPFFESSSGCTDLNGLIDDLTMLVAGSKAVIELPVSQRLQAVSNWLPFFYDLEYAHTTAGGDHDIYDRLTRDENTIASWVIPLNTLHLQLWSEIEEDYNTSCEEGQGAAVVACATGLSTCYCWYTGEYGIVCTGDLCTDYVTSRWQGDYGTCTGSGFDNLSHPVCMAGGGDLYSAKPAWCCGVGGCRSVACITHSDSCSTCSPPATVTTTQNAYSFQGQLAYNNTTGPSEPEQALAVLAALKEDIGKLKDIISQFAQEIKQSLYEEANPDDPRKKTVFYAWQDSKQRFHAVDAWMEPYIENLPHIAHESHWGGIQNCIVLKNATGQFELQAYHYDEDVTTLQLGSTTWWTLRYRKQPDQPEFNKGWLPGIVADLQAHGALSFLHASEALGLLRNFAITSKTRGFYGVNKSDIRIERLQ